MHFFDNPMRNISSHIQRHFRPKRMERFKRTFDLVDSTTILDVGGYANNWSYIATRARITLLNVHFRQDQIDNAREHGMMLVIGDGCTLPFGDASFDVVYSNSVIEHLSNLERQREFADEIRRVGRNYYVQTPNSRFFIEPHYLAPIIHWTPVWIQRRIVRYVSVWGWLERPSQARVDEMIAEIRLLDSSRLQELFPEATIVEERVGPFTKSLQAEFVIR